MFSSKSKLCSSVFTQDQMSFVFCVSLDLNRKVHTFKIETCQVSVNSTIIISKYLIWPWNLEKTCSDRISELLRETRDEDETDLTFFDSVDTRGIHREKLFWFLVIFAKHLDTTSLISYLHDQDTKVDTKVYRRHFQVSDVIETLFDDRLNERRSRVLS